MADDDGELELGADDGDGDADVAVEHLPWAGETIDAADALLERALSYGMFVNKGRALPDVRDGLKPVQRRIITAMDELGARAGRPYVKSAQVIGEVIGNYHPHGDAPVYDAMVRLAQSFSLNVPLVDGQGNWGSVGPKEYSDPAAAYRYTEARLTAATTDWLADLRPQVVEYRPNFTEKKLEPFVLPVTFPNLLVNGSRGIGWSMACEIPPHNLAEACAAAVTLAENPDAALADLLAAMPGPDFPTGGIVVDPDGLAEAYERGSGTFRLQAKFHVEQLPGNLQAVVVTELPFGVSPDQIVAEVVRAARAERITDVTELPKNLSDRSGIRVQIRCKRGGNVTKLIADLMRLTSLRITVGINMTVLVDGAPRQLGLRDALDAFVTFRFEVVTNRLKHERTELLRELKRLVALLAALDAIDRVVQIIRSAEDDDDAREQLKLELKVRLYGAPELVPVDDEQAQQILDMPLKRLTRLNKLRLQEEVAKKAERVDEIDRILDSFDALRAIVVGELRETAKRYGTARRTVLGGESRLAPAAAVGAIPSGPLRVRDLAVVAAPRTDVVLFATASGACTTRPREARLGRVPLNVGATDAVVHATATDTESELNAFSSDGQVYRLRVADVPIEGRISRGVKAVGLGRGASLAALCPVEPAEGYLLLVTAGGEVKRAEAAVFAASHLGGSPALDLPAGDALVAVVPHADADDILLQSAGGKTLRIEAAKLRPVKSPAAGGVAGMRLDAGDRVVAACVARGDVLVLAHERGNGKAIALADIPRKGRGTGGVQGAATDAPRREPAGPVAVAVALAAGETALLMTASGGLTRVAAADVEVSTRAAVSRVLVEVAAGDRVSGAALAP